jgi:hypothetical protein
LSVVSCQLSAKLNSPLTLPQQPIPFPVRKPSHKSASCQAGFAYLDWADIAGSAKSGGALAESAELSVGG